MVTAIGGYVAHPGLSPCKAAEPPEVRKIRVAFDSAVHDILREFVNQSVHGTALGVKALNAGNFVTLEELEGLISR